MGTVEVALATPEAPHGPPRQHGIFDQLPPEIAGGVIACALSAGWVILQAMAEERDLLQRLPDYRAYMERVPRFIPQIRIK